MKSKRIINEKLTQEEKELLVLFRTLKSNRSQQKFIGQAEYLIDKLKIQEYDENQSRIRLIK